MPRIEPQVVNKAPRLGSLRDLVTICTTVERPDGDVSTLVNRPGVIQVHANVRPMRGIEVLDWKAVRDVTTMNSKANTPTHEITLRVPPDVKIDLNHWVYCKDRLGTETWYKVRLVEDMAGVHRFLRLTCSIETINDPRSDPVTQTPPPKWEQPDVAPVIDTI